MIDEFTTMYNYGKQLSRVYNLLINFIKIFLTIKPRQLFV